MKITTLFAIMIVSVCTVAGVAVWWTRSASPLWLVALLFLVNVDKGGADPS